MQGLRRDRSPGPQPPGARRLARAHAWRGDHARVMPSWFREARYGMMIHWGSYALLGMEAAWPLVWGAISYRDYEALAERFKPQRHDPAAWAALAVEAGMKYAVFTTKHHDGFAMYGTQLSHYSSLQCAAQRDFVRPYVEAFRAAGLRVG